MKKNMGSKDKAIRIIIGIVLLGLYFTGVAEGVMGLVALIAAIVLFATSLLNFCPLYLPFGLNTCKTSKK